MSDTKDKNVLEILDDLIERDSKIRKEEVYRLTAEVKRLDELVEQYQAASGLCVSAEEAGGDPGGVTPEHLERYVRELSLSLADARLESSRRAAEIVVFTGLLDGVEDQRKHLLRDIEMALSQGHFKHEARNWIFGFRRRVAVEGWERRAGGKG